ncbi:MAG: hypothetical protein H0T68_11280 [Gemmatimonadales bacterium]|nr:hypothetical protein [Gemmatimonadales bacterium]
MTPFSTFALLYMTAMFLELAEKWTYPVFTVVTLVLAALFAWIGITRVSFLVFLLATTAHFLLVQFPDVANHVNVAIYCNSLLMVGIVFSLVRSREFPTDDDGFELLRPLLQLSMILVYALAGFHKLNADFFDPAVSCVADVMGGLTRMANSRVAGVPTRFVLLAGILLLAYALLSAGSARRPLPAAVRLGAMGATLLAAALVFVLAPAIPPAAMTSAILGMAVIVIFWELIGGPLLAVPRLQLPVLAFSWAMHATLALIGFVDFGALALALLFTFVPRPYRDLLLTRLRLPAVGRSVHRAHVYFTLCVLAGISSGLDRRLIGGMLFNFAALIFIWPMVSAAVIPPRPNWTGIPIASRLTPRWMFLFPVLLLLHGFTSYAGLRTAGNFSMFSNLRTEGAFSNHFLLGGNPLKLWGYQEDAVRFIRIDDRRARIGYQYQPLEGNRLPVVEFRKLIHAWTGAGATVPLTFEYGGRIHSTKDIVNDPVWRTHGRDWEMRLMDFRVIQPEGPNSCRW